MLISTTSLLSLPPEIREQPLLMALLQTTREGVAIVNAQGQIQLANSRLLDWLQLWSAPEQPLAQFIVPECRRRLRQVMQTSQASFQMHLELLASDQTLLPVHLRMQRLEAEQPLWLLMFADLSRERQLESTLAGSHDQQFSLMQSLPVPAVIVRASDSLILQGNEEFSNWYGLPLNSLMLRPLLDFFVHPSDWLFLLEECRREQRICLRDVQVYNPDNSPAFAQTFAQTVTFDGYAAVILVFYDMTQHKQLEKSMAWSKRLLQTMMTAQSQFVGKIEPDMIFLHVLDHVLKMTFSDFGFIVACEPEQPEALHLLAVNHTHWGVDTAEAFAHTAQREFEQLHKQKHFLFQALFEPQVQISEQTEDLHYPWLKSFVGIPLYSSGQRVGMLGLANSPYPYNALLEMELHPLLVTTAHLIAAWRNDQQRRLAEQQLAETNQHLSQLHQDVRQLIDNACVPVFALDLHGLLTDWNPAISQLTGLDAERMLSGVLLEQSLTNDSVEALSLALQQICQGQPVGSLELNVQGTQGRDLRLLCNLTPRRDKQGILIGAWGLGQDITSLADYQKSLQQEVQKKTHALQTALFEQRQMTAHLSQMLEKEEAMFALRDRFAAVASHEFRGPLAAIQIAAENLCNPDVQLNPEQIQRKVLRIKKRADQLHYLVHDILLLTQLDAGHLPFHPELCQLGEFCEQVIEEVQLATRSTHLIHADYPQVLVRLDQRLMRLVLSNLLHNAIKFSFDSNEVWLRISLDGEAEQLHLEVEDRGIGVVEDEISTIFKPFFRSPRVIHKTSGIGLGLELVRRSLDLHQGRIQLVRLEQGTLFRVVIPYRS